MPGHRERSGFLFSYVSIEERIPASHLLRRIRKLADQALDRLKSHLLPAVERESRHLQGPADVSLGLALAEELLRDAELADDLLGGVALAFNACHHLAAESQEVEQR